MLRSMPEEIPYPVRVNRYLALTGVTTRRAADLLIKEGLVFINGKTAATGQYVEDLLPSAGLIRIRKVSCFSPMTGV